MSRNQSESTYEICLLVVGIANHLGEYRKRERIGNLQR